VEDADVGPHENQTEKLLNTRGLTFVMLPCCQRDISHRICVATRVVVN
jgi:hypothetical protein